VALVNDSAVCGPPKANSSSAARLEAGGASEAPGIADGSGAGGAAGGGIGIAGGAAGRCVEGAAEVDGAVDDAPGIALGGG
jgi:hypothetical protein